MEYIFKADDITLSNISSLSLEQSILEERRICENFDIADSAARFSASLVLDGMNLYEILSLITEELSFSDSKIHDNALPSNLEHLRDYLSTLEILDKVLFSKLFIERLRSFGCLIAESEFLPKVDSTETFIYVKNAYANEAYDVFSQEFSEPRVFYALNLRDAISMVLRGDVTYCLLPIEEHGARLPTVAEMIYKSDLRINSVIPVLGFDGLADMKYALVSKAFFIPEVKSDDDRYLEIRIPADSTDALADIILAAGYFKLGIYRINTVRFDTDDGPKAFYSLVFNGEGVDFSGILTYLTLFNNVYTPVGLYKNLE